ncbi:MAG: hypothetical protein PHY29_07700 [Syntrophales bacterium]|jgi:hypothetical protein|nr:hypothetical protein [Syntrophales bacterium]
MGKKMTEAEWNELVSLPDREAQIAWLHKKCLENNPDYDPDDDTVMLAGVPSE